MLYHYNFETGQAAVDKMQDVNCKVNYVKEGNINLVAFETTERIIDNVSKLYYHHSIDSVTTYKYIFNKRCRKLSPNTTSCLPSRGFSLSAWPDKPLRDGCGRSGAT